MKKVRQPSYALRQLLTNLRVRSSFVYVYAVRFVTFLCCGCDMYHVDVKVDHFSAARDVMDIIS